MSTPIYITQSSWARGQVSELLFARNDMMTQTDTSSELTNFVVLQQGGIQKRPGFSIIADTALDPSTLYYYFVFSTTFGNYVILCFNNNNGIYALNLASGSLVLIAEVGIVTSHAINGDSFVVTFADTLPRVITRTDAGVDTFSVKDLFNTNPNSALSTDPYYVVPATLNPPIDNTVLLFGLPGKDVKDVPIGEGDTISIWCGVYTIAVFPQTTNYYKINALPNDIAPGSFLFAGGYNIFITLVDYNNQIAKGIILIDSPIEVTLLKQIVIEEIGQGTPNGGLWGLSYHTDNCQIGINWNRVSTYPDSKAIQFKYCAFFQNRLWLAWDNKILASRVNSPYDFQYFRTDPAASLSYGITNDGSQINGLYADDSIYIFTNRGVYAFVNSYQQTITLDNFNLQKVSSDVKLEQNRPVYYRHSLFFTTINRSVIGVAYDWYGRAMSQIVNILVPDIAATGVMSLFTINDNMFMASTQDDGSLAILQFIPNFNNAGLQLQFMPELNQMSWVRWVIQGINIVGCFSLANDLYIIAGDGSVLKLDKTKSVDYYRTGDEVIGNNLYVNKNCAFHINPAVVSKMNYQNKIPKNPNDVPRNFNANSEYGLAIEAVWGSRPYSIRTEIGQDLLYTPRKLVEIMLYFYETLLDFVIYLNAKKTHPIPINVWDIQPFDDKPRTAITKDKDTATDWDYKSQIKVVHDAWGSCTILGVSVSLK